MREISSKYFPTKEFLKKWIFHQFLLKINNSILFSNKANLFDFQKKCIVLKQKKFSRGKFPKFLDSELIRFWISDSHKSHWTKSKKKDGTKGWGNAWSINRRRKKSRKEVSWQCEVPHGMHRRQSEWQWKILLVVEIRLKFELCKKALETDQHVVAECRLEANNIKA